MDIDDPTPPTAGPSAIPKGFGRIIRDENGNVIDVELAEDDAEESLANTADRLIEEIPDPSQNEDAAGWVALGSSTALSVPSSSTSNIHVVHSEQLSRSIKLCTDVIW